MKKNETMPGTNQVVTLLERIKGLTIDGIELEEAFPKLKEAKTQFQSSLAQDSKFDAAELFHVNKKLDSIFKALRPIRVREKLSKKVGLLGKRYGLVRPFETRLFKGVFAGLAKRLTEHDKKQAALRIGFRGLYTFIIIAMLITFLLLPLLVIVLAYPVLAILIPNDELERMPIKGTHDLKILSHEDTDKIVDLLVGCFGHVELQDFNSKLSPVSKSIKALNAKIKMPSWFDIVTIINYVEANPRLKGLVENHFNEYSTIRDYSLKYKETNDITNLDYVISEHDAVYNTVIYNSLRHGAHFAYKKEELRLMFNSQVDRSVVDGDLIQEFQDAMESKDWELASFKFAFAAVKTEQAKIKAHNEQVEAENERRAAQQAMSQSAGDDSKSGLFANVGKGVVGSVITGKALADKFVGAEDRNRRRTYNVSCGKCGFYQQRSANRHVTGRSEKCPNCGKYGLNYKEMR